MSTIHIHPTVASDVSRIFALQRATGLLAVICGKRARLINPEERELVRVPKRSVCITVEEGPTGPEAA